MSPRSSPNDAGHHSDHDVELDKSSVVQLEQMHSGSLTPEEALFLASFSDEQKETVLRKVDWRLVPMLLVLYLISFIDRANIGMPIYNAILYVDDADNRRQCKDRRAPARSEHERNAIQYCISYLLVSIPTVDRKERPTDRLAVRSVCISRTSREYPMSFLDLGCHLVPGHRDSCCCLSITWLTFSSKSYPTLWLVRIFVILNLTDGSLT
jgi:hypothetical protein